MVNNLHEITQCCDADFALGLNDNSTLFCQQVVRVIPNKRLVCQGVWQQKAVYAKLFIDARAAHYFARDLSGITDLVTAKIATPPLLFQGRTQDGAYVLVFEAIKNSLNAEQVWQKSAAKARFKLVQSLVAEIAKHHNAGLLQTDLYFKNFLVEDDKIYTLDGDGIRKYTRLSKHQAQRNLATLFSKMDVLEDDWMPELYEAYCAQMGIAHSVFDEAEIWGLTQKIRRQTASQYADKKVFRQCTDVKKYALQGAWILASSDAENVDFSGDLDALITPQNLLKDGNTCTLALVEMGGKEIVIKRYNIKNFWHGVSRAFRQTRAAVSWANAHRLTILDVATAKPIALIEQKTLGLLKGKAYFLTEYIDAPDAAEFFAKTREKVLRAEAVHNIVTQFYRLYLLQISHGDTKATNIKMQGTQPVFIDLDAMQQHTFSWSAERAHGRDLRRFMQNWQNDNALYNAFVKAFKVIYEEHAPLYKADIVNNKELNDR
jgi:tRNA A-37 threonylcarbamoyl transferase component Bud32